MTLSRPAAEHYPAAGQTGKPMCGAPAQEQRANLKGAPRQRFRHPGEGLREMHPSSCNRPEEITWVIQT